MFDVRIFITILLTIFLNWCNIYAYICKEVETYE